MKTVIVKNDLNGEEVRCILIEKGEVYSRILTPMHEVNMVSNRDIIWE